MVRLDLDTGTKDEKRVETEMKQRRGISKWWGTNEILIVLSVLKRTGVVCKEARQLQRL